MLISPEGASLDAATNQRCALKTLSKTSDVDDVSLVDLRQRGPYLMASSILFGGNSCKTN